MKRTILKNIQELYPGRIKINEYDIADKGNYLRLMDLEERPGMVNRIPVGYITMNTDGYFYEETGRSSDNKRVLELPHMPPPGGHPDVRAITHRVKYRKGEIFIVNQKTGVIFIEDFSMNCEPDMISVRKLIVRQGKKSFSLLLIHATNPHTHGIYHV